MPGGPRDPWRLPSVERFGEQLRELERAEQRNLQRAPRGRVVALASAATIVLTLAAGAFLDMSRPARALSPVNHAPALALASRSVTFQSTTEVLLGGRLFGRFAQRGSLDFANGNYRTFLVVPSAGVSVESRRVGGVLYFREGHTAGGGPSPAPWLAVHLPRRAHATLVSAPESAGITDPIGLLRILQSSRAPVRPLGRSSMDGIPVVLYRFTSDLASVLEAASGTRAPGSYHRVSAAIVVALDDRGRPLRISETFAGPTGGGTCVLTSTVRFSGYGRPVRVMAPAVPGPSSTHRAVAPSPPIADPARLFERLVFAET